MKTIHLHSWIFALLFACLPALAGTARAASFDGAARLDIADTSQSLSWNPTANAQTVSCWFKFVIPSGVTLSQNMVIVANRTNATWNASNQMVENHAYALYFNVNTGDVDFSTRGTTGYFTKTLVDSPYLERWYHVAVVRNGNTFSGYVDGRLVFQENSAVGDSRSTAGVAIGGLASGYYLRGEVIEFQQVAGTTSRSTILANRFRDLDPAGDPSFRGYYKLAFSANSAHQLKNFGNTPGPGTDPAVKQGSGTITFEAVNRDGEQSLFDAQKNGGADAVAPLAGPFDWEQGIFGRPTPGIAFEFSINYSSANAFNKSGTDLLLETEDPLSPSPLSSGWRHNLEVRAVNVPGPDGSTTFSSIGIVQENGSVDTWDFLANIPNGAKFKTRHKEYRGDLERIGDSSDPEGVVRWITPDRIIYTFRSPSAGSNGSVLGRLREISDFNGNRLEVNIHESGSRAGLVSTAVDTAGGVWTFNYNPQNLLTNVTAFGWNADFTYDASNRLATRSLRAPPQYTVPSSTTWTFAYTSSAPAGLLWRITNPRAIRIAEITYDTFGRKTKIVGADSRTTTFQYNIPGLRQLTTTQQAASTANPANDRSVVETFDRKLRVVEVKDPLGFTTKAEYDEAGNVIQATDARGYQTRMGYDSRSNLIASTNALGQVTTWTYEHVLPGGYPLNEATRSRRPATPEAPTGWENRYEFDTVGNLIRHHDDLGDLVRYTYDSRGLVTASVDANGNETRLGYNASGFPAATTNAYGTTEQAVSRQTVNEFGWVLTSTNPLSETTTLEYNLYGQVVRTVDAIDRVFTTTYDQVGNLTASTDGKGKTTSYLYNGSNERTRMTDRNGSVWDYAYNSFGEQVTTQSPSVLSDGINARLLTTQVYDANGRLKEVLDPYLDKVSFEYDANDNLTAAVDLEGKRAEKHYDPLNRVIAERDPEGNVRKTEYDPAGRIRTVLSPNGYPSTHQYDGRSRLATWTDPENYIWRYQYDGVGNITNIVDALGGQYKMTYGFRNQRLTELNQDLKEWVYTYDPLVRLKTQKDPNLTERTLYYDPVGRLSEVQYHTGRINSLGYDNNNNVVSVNRTQPGRPSTTLAMEYDALDRLTLSRDTFSKSVGYEYDAVGRISAKVYPGGKRLTQTYNKRGFLTGLFFAYSASQTFACTFAYDKVGRLTNRTYPNGITQVNTFDDSGRIKTLDYRTAGTNTLIALSYAYDRNGNKTSGTEKGTLDWQPNSLSDYDETSRFTPAGKLIDRTDTAPSLPTVKAYTYDDSGNMTQATAPGELFGLTYDEDNRTTSILWNTGLSSRHIFNRYDALGRRVSRTADGVETRYVLDLSGGMERILCDSDSSNMIRTYYVHGNDLCFKIDAENAAILCYHADAAANIIQTTAGNSAAVNKTSYTPYGRVISASGPIENAYRYVGCLGVMEEIPGLYFMRARYYSAEAGVFLSVDPINSMGPNWTGGRYSYAVQNPAKLNDPKGENAVTATIGALSSVILKTAVMNYEMITGKKQYTVGEVMANIASSAVSGGLSGFSASYKLGALAKYGITLGADMVGLTVEHSIEHLAGIDRKQSFSEKAMNQVVESTTSFAIGNIIPDVAGAKGGFTWKTEAFKHTIADMGKDLVSTMVYNTSEAVADSITNNGGESGRGNNSGGSGSNGRGGNNISNKTPGAGNYASESNGSQKENPSGPSNNTNGSGGIRSIFESTVDRVASGMDRLGSTIINGAKSLARWFGSLFRR
jgi:RHS repeat-associated protein